MRAGTLRHVVQIQARDTAQDGYGGHATTWTTIATDNAWIAPLQGNELLAAQAIHAEIKFDIIMRYRPELNAAKRIVYNGRPFNILAVLNEDERNRMLTLKCSEGLASG